MWKLNIGFVQLSYINVGLFYNLIASSCKCMQMDKHTVQLSSKVTFARVSDASCTHFRCVLHAFRMRPRLGFKKGVWHSCTSRCSFIARFCACTDTSCAHSRYILCASQTRPARVSDTFEHYLGAELYCNYFT